MRPTAVMLLLLAAAASPALAGRSRVLLDFDWRFHLGDFSDNSATKPGYDDSAWRQVDVPHDFVVEGNFTKSADESHGFLPFGIGWYRKHFVLPAQYKGQTVWVDFDGTYRNTQIWLNGVALGGHQSGYASYRFRVDTLGNATLNYDGENVLVVRCDSTQPEGWWYDGGGIYRHVWLNAAERLHVAPWGVYVPAAVDSSTIRPDPRSANRLVGNAQVEVQVEVANDGAAAQTFTLVSDIRDPSGKSVATVTTTETVAAGQVSTIRHNASLTAVQLWSLAGDGGAPPALHTVVTTIQQQQQVVDQVATVTGFRHAQFDADRGFLLNNQPTKIKGLANHQDFAGLGVAVPDNVQAFRVTQLKRMGGNAWRTAHNPPTPALLDACDSVGFLVWDENHYNTASDPAVIEDVQLMVKRDRNHPSIVLWSICNEVLCKGFNATSAKVIRDIFHSMDPTRAVSAAMNGGWGDDFSQLLDVEGFNYNPGGYDGYHSKFPHQPMIGSETSSCVSDRGIYVNDPTAAYVSAYDINAPGWGQTAEGAWQPIAARDFMSGGFVWTGFDYKGEPTPYGWPNINSHFGIHDIAGFPKDNFWYYLSVWGDQANAMVHVLPTNWNGNLTERQPRSFNATAQVSGGGGDWQTFRGYDSYPNMNFGPNLDTTDMSLCETTCEQRQDCHGFVACQGTCYFRSESPSALVQQRVQSSQGCDLYVNGNVTAGVPVWVYSNADEVELFLNGKSLGRKPFPARSHLEWNVPYEAGSLSATAYRGGNPVAKDTVETTGEPAAIRLTVDWGASGIEANNQDAALVRAAVVDAQGRVVPTASNVISFAVTTTATGRVVGVGNGDPSSHEHDKASVRSAWHGLARAVIQATHQDGEIQITATSPGLTSDTVSVTSKAPAAKKYVQS